MWPWSGWSKPRQSLRIVLLPEPATPSTTLVSPRFNSKETRSSTGESSKLMETSSKMMALCTVSMGFCSSNISFSKQGHGGSAQGDEELREHGVHKQDEHRRHHHRLRG